MGQTRLTPRYTGEAFFIARLRSKASMLTGRVINDTPKKPVWVLRYLDKTARSIIGTAEQNNCDRRYEDNNLSRYAQQRRAAYLWQTQIITLFMKTTQADQLGRILGNVFSTHSPRIGAAAMYMGFRRDRHRRDRSTSTLPWEP